jgi:SAM-dependent methyltransferase
MTMGAVGGALGYRLLKSISSIKPTNSSHVPYQNAAEKLHAHFGPAIYEHARGKTVIDFGSGMGYEAVELAQQGAKEVIGVEIQQRFRQLAGQIADDAGVSDRCVFVERPIKKGDLVMSLDSFEHFDDPGEILLTMSEMLNPDGEVWISFGWPWYHPYGGHLFSVFPWAHLIFTEQALIRWRTDFKSDGAKRFHEVEGGLNQMTINRFQRLVGESPLEFVDLRLKPIRAFRLIHNRLTREFTTALISARLRLSPQGSLVPVACES